MMELHSGAGEGGAEGAIEYNLKYNFAPPLPH